MRDRIDAFIKQNRDAVINLAVDICKIPSMTGNEKKKASYIKRVLNEICNKDVWIDEIGNVLCMHKETEKANISIYTAHIDTVFDRITEINPVFSENEIHAPSIFDNSINVAAQIYAIKMISELNISLNKNILFAFSVGEEGLGNLRGIRHLIHERTGNVDEVIAVDMGYKHVVDSAVGSKTYLIDVKTEGGHSWRDFGNNNAIAIASGLINKLYTIQLSRSPKSTYNVGLIDGGISVNSIAQGCNFYINLRSESKEHLIILDQQFLEIIEKQVSKGQRIEYKLVGERPSGSSPNQSGLLKRIEDIRKQLGLEIKYISGSTDANIPLGIGIPAISFGVCNGGGAHTSEEYIEIDSLDLGLKQFLYFITR